MRKLTLSKETLRILDDQDLTRVVGGTGGTGHGQTGASGHCNATHHGGGCHGQTGVSGHCNATHGSGC
jgi:hypothetical protein